MSDSSSPPTRAFILGAGLGTRLRPITELVPKPLVPIHGRPLVTHALDHLAKAGVEQVVINTHHAPACWPQTFPSRKYQKLQLQFRYEPVLLDTGGGLKNVEDLLLDGGTFWIYNGDILTNLPLQKAWEHHRQSGNLATMVLRSTQEPRHVSLGKDGRITDVRGKLGTGQPGEYLFTGIHLVEPDIFRHILQVEIQSIIPIYLGLIQKGEKIGGVVIDEGEWSDIGTLSEYERVNGQK